MTSIIQTDKEKCYLCGGCSEPLDVHHIFEGVNRKKSEKYGLTVYLCHNKCHIFGGSSVHGNENVNKALKSKAQKIAMKCYDWSLEDWFAIFHKSWI